MTKIITKTNELVQICNEIVQENDFLTVDTEFVREKTYWPKLCLIQIATDKIEAIIDPLAPGIDLAAFFELMQNAAIPKVFHAVRQDVEIFVRLTGAVPTPLIDTQIMAMACGFGDNVGYEKLVSTLAKTSLNKHARFTNWEQRPLTEEQLEYAIGDVTHLRIVYRKLQKRLEQKQRTAWLASEIEPLTRPATYLQNPEEAWQRIKTRFTKPLNLAILKYLAAARERMAQASDIPKSFVLKDETLVELSAYPPKKPEDFKKLRTYSPRLKEPKVSAMVLESIQTAIASPKNQWPIKADKAVLAVKEATVLELLRFLLKAKAQELRVSPKLIASGDDLEALAMDDNADIPALKGWRLEAFGTLALAVKRGEILFGFDPSTGKLQIKNQTLPEKKPKKKADTKNPEPKT